MYNIGHQTLINKHKFWFNKQYTYIGHQTLINKHKLWFNKEDTKKIKYCCLEKAFKLKNIIANMHKCRDDLNECIVHIQKDLNNSQFSSEKIIMLYTFIHKNSKEEIADFSSFVDNVAVLATHDTKTDTVWNWFGNVNTTKHIDILRDDKKCEEYLTQNSQLYGVIEKVEIIQEFKIFDSFKHEEVEEIAQLVEAIKRSVKITPWSEIKITDLVFISDLIVSKELTKNPTKLRLLAHELGINSARELLDFALNSNLKVNTDLKLFAKDVPEYEQLIQIFEEDELIEKMIILQRGDVAENSVSETIQRVAKLALDEHITKDVHLKKLAALADLDFEAFKRLLSTIKLQRSIRRFQSRLKAKPVDKYGVRRLLYVNAETSTKEEFLFSANMVGHSIPKIEISNDGPQGTFKKLIGKDKNNIILSLNQNYEKVKNLNKFTPNEIEKILIQNKLTSFKVATPISDNMLIGHNAGNDDLQNKINHGHIYVPNSFKDILRDLSTLHKNNMAHTDIKPANIQVKDKAFLYLIDLDGLSTIDMLRRKPAIICTKEYYNSGLYRTIVNNWHIDSTHKMKALRINDEFALALSIMQASGVKIPDNNLQESGRNGDLAITTSINNFIEKYIVNDYKPIFKLLILNPYTYFLSSNSEISLSKMFS